MIIQSFKKKLFTLQFTLSFLLLLITWILISINDYYIFKHLVLQKFESTAKILSRNLSTCLTFGDKDECDRVLRSISLEKDIQAGVILDSESEMFGHFIRSEDINLLELQDYVKNKKHHVIRGSRLVFPYPIIENGNYEGHLILVASFDMMDTFGKRHAMAFLVIMLLSAVIGFGVFMTIHHRLTRQIKLILETMNKVRRDKNYRLRIRDEENWKHIEIKEFQELCESFDGMIEQVELRDYSMKKQNEDLEKVIEVKVNELLRSAELASLGEMAGGIAHEINNPLTIIKSTNRILMRNVEKNKYDPDIFTEFLATIDHTVDRIAKIISGLRNISRKSDDAEVGPCTFGEVFTDVFDVAEAKFKSKGIELRKSYSPEDAALVFKANRIQLSQVLVNLLNNAFDAIIDLPDYDKWIEIQIIRSDGKLALRVIDCGSGIPLKVREKMFNPFFTTKEIGKGTGIGLAISKSMVEKMKGHFFYDEKHANTCFVVEFAV